MADEQQVLGSHTGSPEKKDELVSFTLKATTLWKSVSGILLVLLVSSILTGGFSIWGGSAPAGAAIAPIGGRPSGNDFPGAPAGSPVISFDGVYSLGVDTAPVTIVEYSDYQCPFCGKFHDETFLQIKTNYIDTGKVKFYYKHFPLESIHPLAVPASLAAECAGEEGKFWEYHYKIFENQQSLSLLNLQRWAEDLGIDGAKFKNCFNNERYSSKIKEQFREGADNGVQGTPAFFINGREISGAQPFSVFEQLIESELN